MLESFWNTRVTFAFLLQSHQLLVALVVFPNGSLAASGTCPLLFIMTFSLFSSYLHFFFSNKSKKNLAFSDSRALRKRVTLKRNVIRWQQSFIFSSQKRNHSLLLNFIGFTTKVFGRRTFAKFLNGRWRKKYIPSIFQMTFHSLSEDVPVPAILNLSPVIKLQARLSFFFSFFFKLHDLFFGFLFLCVDNCQDLMCKYVSHLPTGTWQVLPCNSSCILVFFT